MLLPLYTYRCPACGFELEMRHARDVDPGLEHHHAAEDTGEANRSVPMARKPARAAVHFRGPGFYATDSRAS